MVQENAYIISGGVQGKTRLNFPMCYTRTPVRC